MRDVVANGHRGMDKAVRRETRAREVRRRRLTAYEANENIKVCIKK